jgi:S1-C subfamily serine protease
VNTPSQDDYGMNENSEQDADPRFIILRQRLKRYTPGAILFALGLISALALLIVYNIFSAKTPQVTINEVNDSIAEAMASATPPPPFSEAVYQAIVPSMVLIQTKTNGDGKEADQSLGSGVIINTNGDILTCWHVVDGATEIEVNFADGSQSTATVTAKEPENDIAVLTPEKPPEQIIPAVLGNPNAMRIGDEAYVVGHPLGLTGSMTSGIISGLNRSFKPEDSDQVLKNLIQIDAAVNPGNSGGPLLNRYGQVIGIVTALANPTDQNFFVGIGFAIPINIAGGAADLPPY